MPSMKFDRSDPAEFDYAEILRTSDVLAQKMRAAYDRDDFEQVAALAEEIGKLYAPSDDNAAHRIAHMAQMVASVHYFGGINYQVNMNNEERMKKFAPPF